MNHLNDSTVRTDPKFKHRLRGLYGADTLKYCYQCGACSAVCPISKFIGIYKPNKIIELARLGLRGLPQSSAFLFCSACTLCTRICPQSVQVHEIMQGLKDLAGDDPNVRAFLSNEFDEVLEALGREMPFPVTYSWICLRPSEESSVDDPFSQIIGNAFERALKHSRPNAVPPENAKRVAVIGSGPAGLTAAWALASKGIAVTVFERQSKPGGMLRSGIPGYRLPKNIVDAEIEGIKTTGVQLLTDTAVDRKLFDSLVTGGEYAAVFIATGADVSRRLRFDGEQLDGVVTALDFLKEYNETGSAKTGKKVVVIGGGNVAADAAGAAIRCGAESVRLFCLEDKDNMPAHAWEIEEIAASGVEVSPSWGPKAILGDGKKVTGVELIRCKSVLDSNGRFNPVFDEKTTQVVEVDTLISAIGQAPDLRFLGEDVGVFRGAVQVDPYTMETTLPGVYAGGDAAAGTGSLIEAITAGKRAAASILQYIV